jgi:hypothetical protein
MEANKSHATLNKFFTIGITTRMRMDDSADVDYDQFLAETGQLEVVRADPDDMGPPEEDYDAPDMVFCTVTSCKGAETCGLAHSNLTADEREFVESIKLRLQNGDQSK